MRDLGALGESTFELWCAGGGLFANGSKIDKTGWDYFVEFPFDEEGEQSEIHKAAVECKVQVKATDKNNRKLSIKLSNLRRLVTAPTPSFFVFIEFDEQNFAQEAFVVHLGKDLIEKVLERINFIEQSNEDKRLNKRTFTIKYDESHRMSELTGVCLKNILKGHIGCDMAKYVTTKKLLLEKAGFDNSSTNVVFRTEGEENLERLIDVSIGVERQVDISGLKATGTRFGLVNKSPYFETNKAKFSMPDLQALSTGLVKFKEEKLSSGMAFKSRLYISPFNSVLPESLRKMRIDGEFFDLIFNPFTGEAKYSFSFGKGIRMEVKEFRNAVKLVSLLSSSGDKIFVELKFEGFPNLKFGIGRKEHGFDFSDELRTLEAATELIAGFEITEIVDISLYELCHYKREICQLANIKEKQAEKFRVEFGVDGGGLDMMKETACIILIHSPVGSHVLGIILVVIGSVIPIENGRFRLESNNVLVEKRIVSERDEIIENDDLVALIEMVESKYDSDYNVITVFDK